MPTTRAAAGGHTETADATPESGIVWIYHFAPDGTATRVANDAVEKTLIIPAGWTWVHLSLADTRCRAWVVQNPRLSELAREILLGPEEHLRMDVLGQGSSAWCPTCSRKSPRRPTPSCGCAS